MIAHSNRWTKPKEMKLEKRVQTHQKGEIEVKLHNLKTLTLTIRHQLTQDMGEIVEMVMIVEVMVKIHFKCLHRAYLKSLSLF